VAACLEPFLIIANSPSTIPMFLAGIIITITHPTSTARKITSTHRVITLLDGILVALMLILAMDLAGTRNSILRTVHLEEEVGMITTTIPLDLGGGMITTTILLDLVIGMTIIGMIRRTITGPLEMSGTITTNPSTPIIRIPGGEINKGPIATPIVSPRTHKVVVIMQITEILGEIPIPTTGEEINKIPTRQTVPLLPGKMVINMEATNAKIVETTGIATRS
jgi:hypothetical protein